MDWSLSMRVSGICNQYTKTVFHYQNLRYKIETFSTLGIYMRPTALIFEWTTEKLSASESDIRPYSRPPPFTSHGRTNAVPRLGSQ